jgi:hypothetical protein
MRLEDDYVYFWCKHAPQRHRGAYANTHAQRRGLNLERKKKKIR